MADKKLNDLAQIPSIGSLKNIYVEDANGNQYKVSKESLAEVLGGLIGTVTAEKSGLMSAQMYNTLYISKVDVSNLIKIAAVSLLHHGVFFISIGSDPHSYGQVIVSLNNRGSGYSQTTIKQITPLRPGIKFYYRFNREYLELYASYDSNKLSCSARVLGGNYTSSTPVFVTDASNDVTISDLIEITIMQ